MNSRTNVLLIVLGLIVLGAAAYMLLAKGEAAPAISETDGENETESAFLALTAEIGAITFDTDVFTDPRFATLRDIRTVILPETAGRTDPFAPLPGLAPEKP